MMVIRYKSIIFVDQNLKSLVSEETRYKINTDVLPTKINLLTITYEPIYFDVK